jgi:hypothetical protein
MKVYESEPHRLHISWQHPEVTVTLKADLRDHSFTVYQGDGISEEVLMSFGASDSAVPVRVHPASDRSGYASRL